MPGTQFYLRNPGLRQDQVDNQAKRLADDAASFERTVQVTAPGDVNLDPRMMLALSGTGTAFDQTYFIRSVTHVFSQPSGTDEHSGYTMTIEAANMDSSRGDSKPGASDTETVAPAAGAEGDGVPAVNPTPGGPVGANDTTGGFGFGFPG